MQSAVLRLSSYESLLWFIWTFCERPASEALTGTPCTPCLSFELLVACHICALDADWGVPRVPALVASCMVCLSTDTSVLAAPGYSLQWPCTLIRSTVCTPPVVHRCVCSVVLCVGPTYLLISITNHGLACSPSLLRLTISCGKTNVCR